MNTPDCRPKHLLRLIGIGVVALTLAGCATHEIGGPSYGYYERPIGDDSHGYNRGPAIMGPRHGYDYYPAYEVYYDRRRGDYIYVDQRRRQWVRSPSPHGLDVRVLLSTPSVHLEFQDSPARYHREVIQTYPRDWRRDHDRHGRGYDPRYDRRW